MSRIPPQLEPHRFLPKPNCQISATPISVRLPQELDDYVRSLENRSEWLVEAVQKKFDSEVDK